MKISQVGGPGACTVAGQTVRCTISNLAGGQSGSVAILVTPAHAGSYANTVSAHASGAPDPNPANNTAKATLAVSSPRTGVCVVPHLSGASAALAKQVLKLLGCQVKVKKVSSAVVSRGTVLKTKPGPGTYPLGRKVTVTVAR